MSVAWFADLDALATHLGATTRVSDTHVRWHRAGSATPVDVHWDAALALVRVRAPLAIDLAGIPRGELALAIAQINFGLATLGLEYDGELAFATHVFLDETARISSTALAALGAAIDQCEQRTARIIAAVRATLHRA